MTGRSQAIFSSAEKSPIHTIGLNGGDVHFNILNGRTPAVNVIVLLPTLIIVDSTRDGKVQTPLALWDSLS